MDRPQKVPHIDAPPVIISSSDPVISHSSRGRGLGKTGGGVAGHKGKSATHR